MTKVLGADAEAISYHYDVGTAFYELWLDESLTYSCALWNGLDDTLHAAQLRKHDFLLDQLGLRGPSDLLDIGCGWGAALRQAKSRRLLRHGVGITASEEQHRHLLATTAGDDIEFALTPWQVFDAGGRSFDGILCVGALEHFARPGLGRRERREAYGEFFGQCRSWLRPGGRLVVQTIAVGHARLDRQTIEQSRFLMREIFPQSMLPRLNDLVEASERSFEIELLRNDRLHYQRTCEAWARALERRRAEAVAIVGDEVVDRYRRYLDVSASLFGTGHLGLLRLVLSPTKPRR